MSRRAKIDLGPLPKAPVEHGHPGRARILGITTDRRSCWGEGGNEPARDQAPVELEIELGDKTELRVRVRPVGDRIEICVKPRGIGRNYEITAEEERGSRWGVEIAPRKL